MKVPERPKKTANSKGNDVLKESLPTKETSVSRLFLFLSLVVAFIAYANTLTHDYTVDDATVIGNNEITKRGVSALPEIFSSAYRKGFWDRDEGLYRPLSLAMFAVEYQLWPDNPVPGHTINVLLFVVTVCFFFGFVTKLFPLQSAWLPFLSSVIFAVHPIHTEVVANIKSRDEILCLLFALASLTQLLKYIDTSKQLNLMLSGVFFFLCFLSKESAVTIAAIAPLTAWFRSDKSLQPVIRSAILFASITGICLIIRYMILGSLTGTAEHMLINNSLIGAENFGERLGSAFMIMGRYLWLLFIPYPLSFDYSFNQIELVSLFSIWSLVPLIIYGYVLVWAIKNMSKRHPVSYGVLFFFITVSLVSNVLFLIESSMAERFLYLPSAGFSITVSWLLIKLTKAGTPSGMGFPWIFSANKLMTFMLVSICTVYGYLAISRNSDWKDNLTLLEKDVKTSPNSARIRYAYGSALLIEKALQEGDRNSKNIYLDRSILQLEKGVSILSSYSEAWYHLGLAYKEKGDGNNAVAAFEKARSQKNFKKADFYIASGIAYGMTGNYENAIKDLKTAADIDPVNAEAYNNLGLYYSDMGSVDSSLKYLDLAIEIRIDFKEAWYNKGNALAKAAKFPEAVASYNKAVSIDPGYTDAILNLGNCYAAMKQYENALKYYIQVVEREPYNKNVLINLGITYDILGDKIKAKEYIERAENL